MPSYDYVIDERERAGARFLTRIRDELQRALLTEKAVRKVTQQSIADKLGVNRSVVNRQFMGLENLTAMTIGELFWALGWEPHFEALKPSAEDGKNEGLSAQTASANIPTQTIAVTTSGLYLYDSVLKAAATGQLPNAVKPAA